MRRAPKDVDPIPGVDAERHLRSPVIPARAAALHDRIRDVDERRRPRAAAVGRARDVEVLRSLRLAGIVGAVPGEVGVPLRVDRTAARERDAEARVRRADEVVRRPRRAAVMRDGGKDLLLCVVDEVDVAGARGEDVLVGPALQRLDEDGLPGRAEVIGAGHVLARLVVLHEGRVDGAAVRGVDDDLRIVLPFGRRRECARCRPGLAAVAGDLQDRVRARAGRAARVGLAAAVSGVVDVVRPGRVDVAGLVGGDRRLPVVAGLEAEAHRGREARRGRGGGRNSDRQCDDECSEGDAHCTDVLRAAPDRQLPSL